LTLTRADQRHFETLPLVRDMQPVIWEAMRFESGLLRRLLEINLLAAFEDEEGNMWIGLQHEDTREHDTWFFMVPSREFAAGLNWDAVQYRMLFGCEGAYRTNYGLQSMVVRLDGYIVQVRGAYHAAFPHTDQGDRTRAHRNALAIVHQYGFLVAVPEAVARAAHLQWTAEMHDLAYHDVRTPEFDGVPRDLVLRAHGLQLIAEIELEDSQKR
jgi:hypothetical protein